MLSSVLRSPIAVRVNIEIMRAFVTAPAIARDAGRIGCSTSETRRNGPASRLADQGHRRRIAEDVRAATRDTETPVRVPPARTFHRSQTGGRIMNLFDQPARPEHDAAALLPRRRASRSAPPRSRRSRPMRPAPRPRGTRPASTRAARDPLPRQVQERHLPAHGRRPGPDGPLRLQAEDGRSTSTRTCPNRSAWASGSRP